jgi:mitochondrial fission protein ELM1
VPAVTQPSCWIVTDGKVGMEQQCLGLAEALAVRPVVKRIRLRRPWRELTPYLRVGLMRAIDDAGDPIEPPWPRLLIASGRQSIAPALAVRRASRRSTFIVQVQNPVIAPRHFDLVVTPRHDGVRGPNVMETRGALNRVTPALLANEADRLAPRLAHLPHPRIAVLVGGDNASYRLTPTVMGDAAEALALMARREGAALLVTPSRRTGRDNEAILRARLDGLPGEIWDGAGENPYFGYLGLADAIIVTADSVNMVSEAATTGKPVHVIALEGGSAKFRAFHEGLERDGVTRPFTGALEHWTYEPLDDTARVAAEIRRRLGSPLERAA